MHPLLRFLFLGLLLMALLIGLNRAVASCFPQAWDLTAGKTFSLAPETEKALEKMGGRVAFTLLASPNRHTTGERLFRQTAEMLDDLLPLYADRLTDVNVTNLDPHESLEARQLLQRFPGASAPCLLITYQQGSSNRLRHEVLRQPDLAEFHGTAAGQIAAIDFHAEQAVTAALLRLSSEQPRLIVYCLTGHGEFSLDIANADNPRSMSELVSLLKLVDVELRPLELAGVEQIPTDADVVMIPGPKSSLPSDEVAKLETYFKHGGSGLLLLDLFRDPRDHGILATGLEDLLNDYGLLLGNDQVVSHTFGGKITLTVPARSTEVDHPLARSIPASGLELSQARSVRLLSGSSARKQSCFPLLVSPPTPTSWAEADLGPAQAPSPDGPNDLAGPIALAAVVEHSDGPTPQPMLVVVGDADFLSNRSMTAAGGHAAYGFVLSSLNWLAGRNVRLTNIPASHRRPYVLSGTPTEHRGLVWKTVLAFSSLIITVGATVWTVRRG